MISTYRVLNLASKFGFWSSSSSQLSSSSKKLIIHTFPSRLMCEIDGQAFYYQSKTAMLQNNSCACNCHAMRYCDLRIAYSHPGNGAPGEAHSSANAALSSEGDVNMAMWTPRAQANGAKVVLSNKTLSCQEMMKWWIESIIAMNYTQTCATIQPTHQHFNKQYRPQILTLVDVDKTFLKQTSAAPWVCGETI